MIIHFICRGNAHRSMMAEAYLKSLGLPSIEVISSGTVADVFRESNKAHAPHIMARIDKFGVADYAKQEPDQLTQERLDSADITICLNKIVADECKQMFNMPSDTIVWDVSDVNEGQRIVKPGEDHYQFVGETYEEIAHNVDELIREKGLS